MVRARLKYNFDFSAVTEYKDERTNNLLNNFGDGHGQMGCKIGEKTLEGESIILHHVTYICISIMEMCLPNSNSPPMRFI